MQENDLNKHLVAMARSLFDRGFTSGSSGNISLRLPDGFLMTPTEASMGRLDPNRISHLDSQGELISGDKPSKEWFMHKAVYQARPDTRAVVHLHPPHAVAVSCLKGLDSDEVLPPLTPYYVMRIGRLALVPFFLPGGRELVSAVGRAAESHGAILLAHHGTVIAGKDLEDAVYASEELEETARIYLALRGHAYNTLDPEQVRLLQESFRKMI